jgi:hypothetical protein
MKELLKSIGIRAVLLAATTAIVWAACSFWQLETDPAKWTELARQVAALLWGLLSFIIVFTNYK